MAGFKDRQERYVTSIDISIGFSKSFDIKIYNNFANKSTFLWQNYYYNDGQWIKLTSFKLSKNRYNIQFESPLPDDAEQYCAFSIGELLQWFAGHNIVIKHEYHNYKWIFVVQHGELIFSNKKLEDALAYLAIGIKLRKTDSAIGMGIVLEGEQND